MIEPRDPAMRLAMIVGAGTAILGGILMLVLR